VLVDLALTQATLEQMVEMVYLAVVAVRVGKTLVRLEVVV
jgi:hypothetical protein